MNREQNNSHSGIKCFILALSFFAPLTLSSPLTLKAPPTSNDGTFVLRLSSLEKDSKNIEIYRNKNGGKYTKVADIPKFSSLSQVIYENGVYGYKVHVKYTDEENSVSDPIFIEVHSSNTLIPKKKETQQLSTTNL